LIHRFVWFAALAWPLAGLLSGNGVSSAAAPPNEGAAPFVLHEMFGVAHPDQIVTFDLSQSVDPQRTILVADDGSEVPYQLIAGGRQLAVRTGLAAGERKLFSPRPGKPAATFQDAVTVRETSAYYEIVNGLTGVRVPKAAATADTDRLPAPVQGVLLRDGKWYGTGPNWLEYQSAADWTKRTVATGMSVTMLERGPLKTVVQVDYRFEHPELKYGQQMLKPAGQGYYTSTITVQAGQPSVLFEEDTDFEPKWSIELYDAVQPTHARYRGHHSSDAKFGYEPDGQRYRAANERGYDCDAEVELHYDQPRSPSYRSSEDTWRLMCVWDPWCFDSGWYWQAFRRDAPESANVVGIFAGPASRAIGAHMSGVGISTAPTGADGKPAFALNLTSYRRGPDARVFPRSRWCWGLFAGTRADIRPAAEVQPINLQMNLHGGVNLNQVHRWTLDFPDPPEGYGTAFMSRQAIDALKTRVRDDPAYFQWLYNNDTYTRPLFDAWRDPGREKLAVCLEQIFRQSHDMLQALVHQGGIYHFSVHYWHGGLAAQRYGVWIDQLLGDPRLTAEERARLKAAAVLFANLVWNDDHAPISSTDHGLNLGTENMPIQQWGYRRFYALFLARHPTMVERAKQVERQLEATVDQVINDSGAEIGCTHYIGASFVPTLNTLLQVKQLGGTDPFRDWPKLAKFAEFFLNLQTPPEPRMGGKRALVTLGDSGVETSEIFGLLGTGFRDADPRLSKRLMEAWAAGGKQHSFFFGTTTVMIDDTLAPSPGPVASGQEPARAGEAPAAPPRSSVAPLADATFPGYCSVLRHGWNTQDETDAVFRERRFLPRPPPSRPRLGRAVRAGQTGVGGLVGDLHAPCARCLRPFDGRSRSSDRARLEQGRRTAQRRPSLAKLDANGLSFASRPGLCASDVRARQAPVDAGGDGCANEPNPADHRDLRPVCRRGGRRSEGGESEPDGRRPGGDSGRFDRAASADSSHRTAAGRSRRATLCHQARRVAAGQQRVPVHGPLRRRLRRLLARQPAARIPAGQLGQHGVGRGRDRARGTAAHSPRAGQRSVHHGRRGLATRRQAPIAACDRGRQRSRSNRGRRHNPNLLRRIRRGGHSERVLERLSPAARSA
jgi:hypothetical protein